MRLLKSFLIGAVSLMCVSNLFAQQIYFTNEPKQALQVLNTATKGISTLYSLPGKPDDLTLNSQGQLIYSIPSLGTVNLFDPVANVNTVLIPNLKYARDLAIEPGGQTMLVAVYSPGKIVRYNFSTGTWAFLNSKLGGTCDGIAYDAFNNLYAVVNHNTIVQLDPNSGAILNTLVMEPHSGINGADGMTFDPFTGNLWATHAGTTGKGLIQIFTLPQGGFGSPGFNLFLFPLSGSAPDGIKSDDLGDLYVGAINTIFEYNIAANAITRSWVVSGADGISLVPGTH